MPRPIRRHLVPFKRFGLTCSLYGLVQGLSWIWVSMYLAQNGSRSATCQVLYASLEYLSMAFVVASAYLMFRIICNEPPYPKTMCTRYAYVLWSLIVLANCVVDLLLVANALGLAINGQNNWFHHFRPPRPTTEAGDTLYHPPLVTAKRAASKVMNRGDTAMPFNLTNMLLWSSRFVLFWVLNLLFAATLLVAPCSPNYGTKCVCRRRYSQYNAQDHRICSEFPDPMSMPPIPYYVPPSHANALYIPYRPYGDEPDGFRRCY